MTPDLSIPWRRLAALLLVLLVATSAQGVAAARGMPAASGRVELCTGTGPAMVYVDAQGAPTAAPHLCPDWSAGLLAAVMPPFAGPVVPAAEGSGPVPVRAGVASDGAGPDRASARDPPRRS